MGSRPESVAVTLLGTQTAWRQISQSVTKDVDLH